MYDAVNAERTGQEYRDSQLRHETSSKTSMQQYWNHELDSMEKTNAASGSLNKYFMPKYFQYIFTNYLPSCTLWSGLLLSDLRRYSESYVSKFYNHLSSPSTRTSQVDNNTNAEVELFFKEIVKKSCSFKGKWQLSLDTFIGENWVDNN